MIKIFIGIGGEALLKRRYIFIGIDGEVLLKRGHFLLESLTALQATFK